MCNPDTGEIIWGGEGDFVGWPVSILSKFYRYAVDVDYYTGELVGYWFLYGGTADSGGVTGTEGNSHLVTVIFILSPLILASALAIVYRNKRRRKVKRFIVARAGFKYIWWLS